MYFKKLKEAYIHIWEEKHNEEMEGVQDNVIEFIENWKEMVAKVNI